MCGAHTPSRQGSNRLIFNGLDAAQTIMRVANVGEDLQVDMYLTRALLYMCRGAEYEHRRWSD